MDAIYAAAIGGFFSLIVCLITNHASNEKTRALMEYQISELTKRMDKHNNVIERTYKLEEAVARLDERQRTANHRIDDLEKNNAN